MTVPSESLAFPVSHKHDKTFRGTGFRPIWEGMRPASPDRFAPCVERILWPAYSTDRSVVRAPAADSRRSMVGGTRETYTGFIQ